MQSTPKIEKLTQDKLIDIVDQMIPMNNAIIQSARLLLSSCIMYLGTTFPEKDCTYENVGKLLTLADSGTDITPLDVLFEELKTEMPEHIALEQYDAAKMLAGENLFLARNLALANLIEKKLIQE